MKYLKQFENLIEEPQVGDYVICTDVDKDDAELIEFISNTVGQIVQIVKDVQYNKNWVDMCVVKYDNIPKEVARRNFNWHETDTIVLYDRRGFYPDEILFHSKNKEDALSFIEASKYNL